MKNKALVVLLITAVLCTVANCERDKSNPTGPSDEDNHDKVIARKPNIYIYPEQEEQLEIKILFPQGGKIVDSEPRYENGWNISVNTSGIINDEFRYLFYECQIPHLFQTDEAWLVIKDDLEEFFKDNMKKFGFNVAEIKDFIEYWIPVLHEYKYYLIYPQKSGVINKLVKLQFSKEPESIQRLYYLFKGVSTNSHNLKTPKTIKFVREGYTVIEWGGMLIE